MPNIRAQSGVTLSLVASDGRSITIEPAELLAHYEGESGSAEQRYAATVDWAKGRIVAALGEEQVSAQSIDVEFELASGRVIHLAVRG